VNSSAPPTVAIPNLSSYLPQSVIPAKTRWDAVTGPQPEPARSTIALPYRPVDLDELNRNPESEQAESAKQWTHSVKTAEDRELETAKSRFEFSVSQLAETILERFPLAAPAIILFVGTDNNIQVDSTSAALAAQLASRNIGDILLVDSNEVGALTHDQGLTGQPGLSDLVNHEVDWQSLITHGESACLDFLPTGSASWKQWGGMERLRSAAAEMKKHYQFVCVSAGEATEDTAAAWSGLCDGSYLLVSLKDANGTIAEAAVAELRTNGARLLGCIVTDIDG